MPHCPLMEVARLCLEFLDLGRRRRGGIDHMAGTPVGRHVNGDMALGIVLGMCSHAPRHKQDHRQNTSCGQTRPDQPPTVPFRPHVTPRSKKKEIPRLKPVCCRGHTSCSIAQVTLRRVSRTGQA